MACSCWAAGSPALTHSPPSPFSHPDSHRVRLTPRRPRDHCVKAILALKWAKASDKGAPILPRCAIMCGRPNSYQKMSCALVDLESKARAHRFLRMAWALPPVSNLADALPRTALLGGS